MSDEPESQSGDGRGGTGPASDDEADDESETGRYDKYVEYILDLLSFL